MLEPLLALWLPFVHPLPFPAGGRLWMFFPLAACVAVVYRATRAERAADLPKATLRTFLNIVLGMWAIAIGAYALHMAVIHWLD